MKKLINRYLDMLACKLAEELTVLIRMELDGEVLMMVNYIGYPSIGTIIQPENGGEMYKIVELVVEGQTGTTATAKIEIV